MQCLYSLNSKFNTYDDTARSAFCSDAWRYGRRKDQYSRQSRRFPNRRQSRCEMEMLGRVEKLRNDCFRHWSTDAADKWLLQSLYNPTSVASAWKIFALSVKVPF